MKPRRFSPGRSMRLPGRLDIAGNGPNTGPARMKRMTHLICVVAGVVLALSGAAAEHPSDIEQQERQRAKLPDFSHGTTGILGPFIWGRAADLGEDARFADAQGVPRAEGEFLWTHQYMRLPRPGSYPHMVHARNNFISRDPAIGYAVQPAHFVLNTPGTHNAKIIFGYMERGAVFQNGDNADLAHLARAGRVCVFIPVRHAGNIADPLDQANYFISPLYQAQSICVIEFKPGEMIQYEWFRDPHNLHPRILFDLAPYFTGEHRNLPGLMKPVFRFDVDGKGGWTLRIRRDTRPGRDDTEQVFTHESPGAKPYTVNVTADNAVWALSTFSPGGSPADTSQVLLGLQPYDRSSGAPTPWPDRSARVRETRIEDLRPLRK
jgi:hypothetical protein